MLEVVFQNQDNDLQRKLVNAVKFVDEMQKAVSDIVSKIKETGKQISESKDTSAKLGEIIERIASVAEQKLVLLEEGHASVMKSLGLENQARREEINTIIKSAKERFDEMELKYGGMGSTDGGPQVKMSDLKDLECDIRQLESKMAESLINFKQDMDSRQSSGSGGSYGG